jgi:hypothetical protein
MKNYFPLPILWVHEGRFPPDSSHLAMEDEIRAQDTTKMDDVPSVWRVTGQFLLRPPLQLPEEEIT